MKHTAVLKINCPDKKGILAGITTFVYQNNGNIISLNEFADTETRMFYMRLEWDLEGFKTRELRKEIGLLAEKIGFQGHWELHTSDRKINMAVFVSKYDHCLYDLLLRQKSGELDCNIKVIISNHEDLRGIANNFGIPFEVVKVNSENKDIAEERQEGLLKKYEADFIVMARYMQILSDEFIRKHENKIINIHHSFLPAFEGAKPYHQAYNRGVKLIGATAHFANSDLDKGPIIKQGVIDVTHKDSVEDLIIKGRDTEKKVLSEAVKLYVSHRIFVHNNRTIIL